MTTGDFTCESCHGEFRKNWTDDEALDEYNDTWVPQDGEPLAIVCDDCFKFYLAKAMTEAPQLLKPYRRAQWSAKLEP